MHAQATFVVVSLQTREVADLRSNVGPRPTRHRATTLVAVSHHGEKDAWLSIEGLDGLDNVRAGDALEVHFTREPAAEITP